MPEGPSSRWTAVRTVLANRRLARALRGFVAFNFAEQGCWLAILLFAYGRGGIGETGQVVALLLIPAALLAPVVSATGDLFPRHRVLTVGFALNAVSLIATGVFMLTAAPVWSTYGAAVVFSVCLTFAGPAMAAVLPAAAETPDQLTAANVTVGLVETLGRLGGPALAGVILTVGSPGHAVVVLGALALLGALATLGRVDVVPSEMRHADDPDRGSARSELAAGLRVLRTDADVRVLTAMIVLTAIVAGALDVGAAAIAIEVLGRDESSVSVLVTAYGVGALVGSLGTLLLVGKQRLGLVLVVSAALMAVAFGTIGVASSIVVAVALLVIVGTGVTLTSVAGRTMMQGLAPDDTLARLFGALEGLEAIGLAVGGIGLSVVAVQFGIEAACAAVAVLCLAILAVALRRLRQIDADRRPTDPAILRLARSSPVFGPLPPFVLEQLLHAFTTTTHAPGEQLLRRGDDGDRLFLVGEGHVVADTGAGDPVRRDPGAVVGEIALLHRRPRTADVYAGDEGATVHWMDGHAFLRAVARVPRSRARLEAESQRRLQSP